MLGADGLYGSVWASSIADYGGARTEVDFIAGDRQQVGLTTVDLSVVRYPSRRVKRLRSTFTLAHAGWVGCGQI